MSDDKNKGGRPPIYSKVKQLDEKIEEYKQYCEDKKKSPTLTGMCLFIGFNSKDTFYEYGKKEEFSDSIKKARLWIESLYEEDLRKRGNAGTIFALKNMGWYDKPPKDDYTGEAIIEGFKAIAESLNGGKCNE